MHAVVDVLLGHFTVLSHTVVDGVPQSGEFGHVIGAVSTTTNPMPVRFAGST
jgi:F420-0:gamma-glutamyl ligase-like protein